MPEVFTREDREPWERQLGESSRAFAAFCMYRDMGPKRNLRGVARLYYEHKTRPNLGQIKMWSSKWGWVARVTAWDDLQDALARERFTAEIQQMRDHQARLGVALQQAAAQGLKDFRPKKATGHAIARLAAEGVKIERLARGEATEIEEERRLSLRL
jgi:hypothetical protein